MESQHCSLTTRRKNYLQTKKYTKFTVSAENTKRKPQIQQTLKTSVVTKFTNQIAQGKKRSNHDTEKSLKEKENHDNNPINAKQQTAPNKHHNVPANNKQIQKASN